MLQIPTAIAEADWNAYERSWDFQSLPLLTASSDPTPTLESSYTAWITQNRDTIAEMKRLEEENNRLFIDAYGLADELTPDVPIEQITLTVNPAYRYGGKLTEEEQWTRFRQDTMEELVSYAIGCMMGRYSLDEPGLIYAHSRQCRLRSQPLHTFPPTPTASCRSPTTAWFDDDAAHRMREFLLAAWGAETTGRKPRLPGGNLGQEGRAKRRKKRSAATWPTASSRTTCRPTRSAPSTGCSPAANRGAFQALVYLHRYNEGTLARMRSEYVDPAARQIAARIEQLDRMTSPPPPPPPHRNKLQKQPTR